MFVFSGYDKKRDSKLNFDVLRSQKRITFKAGDNYGKICNVKPATFLSPEDSNCLGASQTSTKQRNGELCHLDPNKISRLSKRNFFDDGVSPKNELRRSDRLRTRRRIYDAESGTYKPV